MNTFYRRTTFNSKSALPNTMSKHNPHNNNHNKVTISFLQHNHNIIICIYSRMGGIVVICKRAQYILLAHCTI